MKQKTKQVHATREEYLLAAVALMTPLFESAGYKVPTIRVACGWPSKGGLAAKKRTIGQAWSPKAAEDKVGQIFISPFLSGDAKDSQGVLPTLVHEVAHEVVGVEHGHKKVFGKCARAVGLEGKLTSTIAGENLMAHCRQWAEKLGEYPHGKLDQNKGPVKKQTTRLIKCECPECGFTVRTTRKWLDEVGAPLCPKHPKKGMMFDVPEELGGDEDEE